MVIDFDTGIYFRPEVGRKILVGGIEAQCDGIHWVDNADDFNDSLSEEWTNLVCD